MKSPRRFSGGVVVLAGAVAIAALLAAPGKPAASGAPQDGRPHLYDVEYPVMNYLRGERTDPVARLEERLANGEVTLEYSGRQGYLDSLLHELGVDVRSQTLVFSRTSAQIPFISAATPRAMYYTDDVYVAWPLDAPEIEIASMDPNLGPLFYTVDQDATGIRIERRMDECLRCHDTYALTGGGVPRFIVGSGYTDELGELVSHEGWILVDDQTPWSSRWGGWYVTGTHGRQTHLGNWVIRDLKEFEDIDLTRTGNVTDLGTLIDTEPYLAPHSDIVALMVLDHQTTVQNLITRVNFETRTLLDQAIGEDPPTDISQDERNRIAEITEPLVEALLVRGQPALDDHIHGTSGFAEFFASQGPRDQAGRSLRDLDLETRLFRYPCSYLIYSDAFGTLPEAARQYVYGRLNAILAGGDVSETFAYLSTADRRAVHEILLDTLPEFRRFTASLPSAAATPK